MTRNAQPETRRSAERNGARRRRRYGGHELRGVIADDARGQHGNHAQQAGETAAALGRRELGAQAVEGVAIPRVERQRRQRSAGTMWM
jgi:hypothetical protein